LSEEDVQTVTNKYLVTDGMEESPDLLTDPLDENDSALFLSPLVPTRILFKVKAAYEGGRSEMDGRTGVWREVKVFSRVLLQTSYSLTGRLLFDGMAAL
jgi:hypothetical protein